MKKILSLSALFFAVISCGPTKDAAKRPLYEVLLQENYDGASFEFYETITDAKEFGMILNHPKLKGKVKPQDIDTANFVLLNLGEKNTGGYAIGVEKAEETPTSVILTLKKTEPEPGAMVTMALTKPYAVVRVNSKKEIVIQ